MTGSPSSRIRPLVGRRQAGEQVEQRRLAAAAGPDEREELARRGTSRSRSCDGGEPGAASGVADDEVLADAVEHERGGHEIASPSGPLAGSYVPLL